MHVEDQVAVVGDHALANLRRAAEFGQFAGDMGACHRDHLHRQGKFAHHRHPLRCIADADEGVGHRGDDLFARQRAAAALDHGHAMIDLVRAIDIDAHGIDIIQVEHADAVAADAA
jgi:hypothetical protein